MEQKSCEKSFDPSPSDPDPDPDPSPSEGPPASPPPGPTPAPEPPDLGSPHVHIRFSNQFPKQGNTFVVNTWLRRCPGNEFTTIELERRQAGAWIKIGETQLDAECLGDWTQMADFKRRSYRTVWPQQNDEYTEGRSHPRTVTPRIPLPGPRVKLASDNSAPAMGDNIALRVRIVRCPGLEGNKIQLYKLVPGLTKSDVAGNGDLILMSDGVYRKVAAKRVNGSCHTEFDVTVDLKSETFSAIWPQQDPRYRRGHSKPSVIVSH